MEIADWAIWAWQDSLGVVFPFYSFTVFYIVIKTHEAERILY